MKFCSFSLLLFFQAFCLAQSDLDYFIKSKVEESYNNLDSSIYFVSKAISIKPEFIYYSHRAGLFFKKNDYSKAIEDYKQASQNGENINNYYIAKCYSITHNWEQANIWLRKYLSGNNKLPSNVIKTDTCFEAFKNNILWTEIWKNNWYSNLENYIAEIYYLYSKKANSEIFDVIDTALKYYPQNDELWLWRAKAFELGNNPKEVLLSIDNAIRFNTNRSDLFFMRAKLLNKNGKYKKAITDYTRALNIEPSNILLLKERGLAKIEIGDYNGAFNDLLKYQYFYYKDANSLYYAGKAAYLNKNLQQAINAFSIALKIDNSIANCYFERGRCFLEDNKLDTAFSDFCMAIDLNPNNGEYFFYRGLNYFELKNNTGACSDWEKAKNLNFIQAEQYMLRVCSKINK